jgi:hypothetical protein
MKTKEEILNLYEYVQNINKSYSCDDCSIYGGNPDPEKDSPCWKEFTKEIEKRIENIMKELKQ